MIESFKIWVFLILATLFWAGNYVFGKYVVVELSLDWITFSRWVLALFILFPLAFAVEKPNWKKVKESWRSLLLLGILGIIGYNLILYSALGYTSLTNAALISAINPGLIVYFSFFIKRVTFKNANNRFIYFSIWYTFILTGGDILGIFQTSYNRGDLLMIGAVIIWTFYSIIGKRLSVPPITATAVSTLLAMVILAPFALWEGFHFSDVSQISIYGIVYIFLFSSVCSFVFWNMSVKKIGTSQAGIFLNLIPVFTALISLTLGESVRSEQIVGGLLVFIGVYLTSGMLQIVLSIGKERRGFSRLEDLAY